MNENSVVHQQHEQEQQGGGGGGGGAVPPIAYMDGKAIAGRGVSPGGGGSSGILNLIGGCFNFIPFGKPKAEGLENHQGKTCCYISKSSLRHALYKLYLDVKMCQVSRAAS